MFLKGGNPAILVTSKIHNVHNDSHPEHVHFEIVFLQIQQFRSGVSRGPAVLVDEILIRVVELRKAEVNYQQLQIADVSE